MDQDKLNRLAELGKKLPEEDQEEFNGLVSDVASGLDLEAPNDNKSESKDKSSSSSSHDEPEEEAEPEPVDDEKSSSSSAAEEAKEEAEEEAEEKSSSSSEQEPEPEAEVEPEAEPVKEESSSSSSSEAEPEPEAAPVKEERPKQAPVRRATTTKLSTGNSFEEVKSRVPPVTPRAVDLTDDNIAETYVKIRDDEDDSNWMVLSYTKENQNKLEVHGSGSGGYKEMAQNFIEEPMFAYLRYTYGDTNRAKFIFIAYVPDNLNGLKKARINGHRPAVEAFLKYFHISIAALSKDDYSERNITAKLSTAGGAQYGVGGGGSSSGGEDFSAVKNRARGFYSGVEKEGNIAIVYEKGPLTITPCDLSGRPMVANATEVKKNTDLVGKLDKSKIR